MVSMVSMGPKGSMVSEGPMVAMVLVFYGSHGSPGSYCFCMVPMFAIVPQVCHVS